MKATFLIRAPDYSEVALEEEDMHALRSYHLRHAATALNDEDYAFHQERSAYITRCLRDERDHTEASP